MTNKIAEVLEKCGYKVEATEENLIACFLDYVGSGYFSNLEYDDAFEMLDNNEITLNDMISALK